MITLTVENENPFNAGWLACHMGLPADCMPDLVEPARSAFDAGFAMRAETADMELPDAKAHGDCHIALLMMTTNQDAVPFVRCRVSIAEGSTKS